MENTILHKETETNGLFYIEKDGKIIAEMHYSFSEDDPTIIVVKHTDVKPDLKGQGIGTKLLDALAEYARKKNLKVTPLCPFVEVQFNRNKKYNDIEAQ
ncbi:MAG: GNAT family N-acetyltransferase [Flavobacteriaceae bacterium]